MMGYTMYDSSGNQANKRGPWGAIARGAGITVTLVAAAAIFYYALSVALEREDRREGRVIQRNRNLAETVYKPNEPTIDQINQATKLYKTPNNDKKTIDSHF